MLKHKSASHKRSCYHNNLKAIRVLWIIFSLFIVYGILIPFWFVVSKEAILSNIAHISWIPFIDPDGSRVSIPDVAQNIMLFLPFGFLGFLSIQEERKDRIARITFIGAIFSLSIEILQLFTINRTTSVTDLVVNTIGTFFGALVASITVYIFSELMSSCYVQRFRYTNFLFPLFVSFGIIVLGALHPFDFTLDVGSVWPKVNTLIHDPLDFSLILRDEAVVFLRFLLFAYVCSLFFQENEQNYCVLKGIGISCVLGVCLEGSQLIVDSRMPGVQNLLVMLGGSIAGGLLALVGTLIQFSRIIWGILIIFATLISAGIQLLSPFQIAEKYRNFNWIPFLIYYQRTNFEALSTVIESLLLYFPMGFLLQYLFAQKKSRFLSITLITLSIALPLECMQGWIVNRYPDITDIFGCLIGALAGSWCCVEGWAAFNRDVGKT